MWITSGVDRGRGGVWAKTEDDKVRGFLVEKKHSRIQGLGRAREVVAARFGERPDYLHDAKFRRKSAPGVSG